MRLNIVIGCACLLFLLSMGAWAEGTVCGGNETPVIPDGRVVNSVIPASTTFFFLVQTQVGHEYSVELRSPAGTYGTLGGAMTIYSPTDTLSTSCATSTVSITDTTAAGPALTSGSRQSFNATDTTNSGFYRIKVVNSLGTSVNYSISAVDTTLFNPRWSTFSGFITQWGFKNTSDISVTCKLTANDTLGNPKNAPATISFTVAAGASAFKIIGNGSTLDINAGPQHGGDAFAACSGPPGSMKADAYFLAGNPTVIVPSTFAPR